MPQLDFIIAFPQIFWLVITFFSLYMFLIHFFLPSFIKLQKARKQIVTKNFNTLVHLETELDHKQGKLSKTVEKNFIRIKIMLEKEIFTFFLIYNTYDLKLVDKKIANALYNNIIHYDINTLESIPVKPIFKIEL